MINKESARWERWKEILLRFYKVMEMPVAVFALGYSTLTKKS
jgi:hypothetical protein